MNYFKPENVISPKDYVEILQILHDGGVDSYSVAKIKWNGNDVIGVRWNVAQREWDNVDKLSGKQKCVGMPSSRGYPVWFVLPNDFLQVDSEIVKILQNATKNKRHLSSI